ncbi:MAG: phosphatidylglycerol lysyltransferase domain-containing protein [Eubacteriales bacterium]|nr:phosphatidylglycerol lysyltransferase domain-containing protein [Eubacteriales bacterium]
MNINFKRPELEDQEIIKSYLGKVKTRSCECTFANVYLWSRFYFVEYAVVNDALIFKCGKGEETFFDFPFCDEMHRKPAIEIIKAYCEAQGMALRFGMMTPEQFSQLEELYPGEFEIAYDRDRADYVYETEKLANLSGKKYHGKKNHVNKFKKTYADWSYETITEDNLEDCFQMALKWRNINGCEEDEEKNAELCVTLNSLRLFRELDLRGGLLRVNGEVVAFTIGEPVCDDTMVVHIEKAFADMDGAYPMINQQFIQHEAIEYRYVNREEDLGEEGLRKAKLSYRPVFLVEKGFATRKRG